MKELKNCGGKILLSEFILKNTDFGPFKVKKLISKGEVKVDGVRKKEDAFLCGGETVLVYADDEVKTQVVFQDDNVLFAVKPEGIEVLGEKSFESRVNRQFGKEGQKIRAVNRLDRNTSGIVCFAKNDEAEEELLSAFKNRQVDKLYETLVYGVVKQKHALLEAWLFKDAKKSLVYIYPQKRQGAVPIKTEFTVKETYKNYTRLTVRLHTGRTHQIRAHLAFIGHPILGDGKYSSNEINKQFPFKNQALCAVQYTFKLPEQSFLSYLNTKLIKISPPF